MTTEQTERFRELNAKDFGELTSGEENELYILNGYATEEYHREAPAREQAFRDKLTPIQRYQHENHITTEAGQSLGEIIAEAVAAEKERCAKIALEIGNRLHVHSNQGSADLQDLTGEAIAEAIRAPE